MDYTTSKLGCWVAFDRAVRMAESDKLPAGHMEGWRCARNAVRDHIEARLWSDRKRSYVQQAGSEALDAGCLLAAPQGVVDPRGERMASTIEAVRRELGAGGPLLYRYSGMQEEENAFLACSFWLVEALALAGRLDEASELMDQLVRVTSASTPRRSSRARTSCAATCRRR